MFQRCDNVFETHHSITERCTERLDNPMSGTYSSAGCLNAADESVCKLSCHVGMELQSKYGGAICDNGEWTHEPECVRMSVGHGTFPRFSL